MNDVRITYKGITYIREDILMDRDDDNHIRSLDFIYYEKSEFIDFTVCGYITDKKLINILEKIYQRRLKLEEILKT